MSIKQEPGTMTEDLTRLEPNHNIRDIKNNIEENFPQVKTECCSQEEDSASPNTTLSQGQWFESVDTVVKEEVSTLNVFRNEEGYSDNTDELQEKWTSVKPSYSQSSNNHITDTDCETKSELLLHQEEFSEHSSQIVPKSELTMSTDTNTDNKDYLLWDVKDFQKSLPPVANVLPNQQEQVKLYKCSTCPYECNLLFDLCQHNILHTMENCYVCDLCQSSYQYFLDLKCHLRSHTVHDEISSQLHVSHVRRKIVGKEHKMKHTDEKPYFCNFCDYTSRNSGHLQEHRRRHTGEKPYSCDLCAYTCRQSSHLKTHKRMHTGEKPYSCDLCAYTCRQSSQLIRHKRRHTSEKPYSCDLCDFTCRQSSHLRAHKRRHTGEKPYSCDLCDFTCRFSSNLKAHKKRHIGEKPYACDLCNYTCRNSGDLKTHKRRHTGEKPYSCDLCDYTCIQSSQLNKHKRRHTDKKP